MNRLLTAFVVFSLLSVGMISFGYAENVTATAKQPNLTDEEQRVLDVIASKSDEQRVQDIMDKLTVEERNALEMAKAKTEVQRLQDLRDNKDAHLEVDVPLTVQIEKFETEQTVIIKHPVESWHCDEPIFNGFIPYTPCYFVGTDVTKDTDLAYDIRTETWIPALVLQEEAKQACLDAGICTANTTSSVVTTETLTGEPVEQTNQELIDIINQDIAEFEELNCLQGQFGTTTAGSQHERAFPAPFVLVDTYKDVDGEQVPDGGKKYILDPAVTDNESLKGHQGAIYLAKAECAAQQILDNPQGGLMSEADRNYAYCDELPVEEAATVRGIAMCGMTDEIRQYQLDTQNRSFSQAFVNQQENLNTDWTDPTRDTTDPKCGVDKGVGHRLQYQCDDPYGEPVYDNSTAKAEMYDPMQDPIFLEAQACKEKGICTEQELKVVKDELESKSKNLAQMLRQIEALEQQVKELQEE